MAAPMLALGLLVGVFGGFAALDVQAVHQERVGQAQYKRRVAWDATADGQALEECEIRPLIAAIIPRYGETALCPQSVMQRLWTSRQAAVVQ